MEAIGEWLDNTSKLGDTAQGAGLFMVDGNAPVPLKHREVRSEVYCDVGVAETLETLSYVADKDCSVRFKFPLPPRSSVFRFEATVGERTIVTEVKKKAAAEAEYGTAVSQGHTAVLAKQEEGNVFSVDIGNLEAMQECVVRIVYVGVLQRLGSTLEYVHTATWVPPFVGAHEDVAKVAAATPVFAPKVTYKLDYAVRLLSPVPIAAVESVNGSLNVTDDPRNNAAGGAATHGYAHAKTVSQAADVSDASRDFQVVVELAGALPEASVALQRSQPAGTPPAPADKGRKGFLSMFRRPKAPQPAAEGPVTHALVTFCPRLPEAAAAAVAGGALDREIWFVIDCSGSMGGTPIEQAKQAALLFVRDLPAGRGVRFNVVLFGSSVEFMTPASVAYDKETEAKAVAYIQAVGADLGGTEIQLTMERIYDAPLASGCKQREIVFLTDGGISGGEEQAVCNLLAGKSGATGPRHDNAKHTHVFCLGIGNGVHRGLLEKMAAESGGAVSFVLEDEGIAKKCGYLKKCATAAALLTRPRLVARSCLLKTAPFLLPPMLFPGEPVTVLAEVCAAEEGACLELTTQLAGDNGPDGQPATVSLRAPIDATAAEEGSLFSVLHAMAYISGLEGGKSQLHVRPDGTPLDRQPDDQVVESEIVRAAIGANLVTRHTSAVGIMLQANPLDAAKVERLEVPIALPHGRTLWQERQAPPPMPMACPPPMMARAMFGAPAPMMAFCAAPAPMRCMAAAPGSAPPGAMFKKRSAPKMMRKMMAEMAAPDAFMDEAVECSAAAPMMDVDREKEVVGGAANFEARSFDAFGARASAAPPPAAPAAPPPPRTPPEALSSLNLLRSLEGCWQLDDPTLDAVVCQKAAGGGPSDAAAAKATLLAAKPAALSDAAWATVLALAFLRRHLPGERGAWEGMESKALEWLAAHWPQQGAGSVAMAILNATKLL